MLTQEEAKEKFLPRILSEGVVYRKTAHVDARPAQEGEVVITVTGDGVETRNVAKTNEVVTRARVGAREEWIQPVAKFAGKYHLVGVTADGWFEFAPNVDPKADVTVVVYEGEPIEFVAKWGSPMVLKQGDAIVTPTADPNEVYRIARREFEDSYSKL